MTEIYSDRGRSAVAKRCIVPLQCGRDRGRGAPDSHAPVAHAGRPGPRARGEPRHRGAVGDGRVRHPRTDRTTAAAHPGRTAPGEAIAVRMGTTRRALRARPPARWRISTTGPETLARE